MPETDLTTFDLLPADAALSADSELERALGYVPDDDFEDDTLLPLGRGWAFDWSAGQFFRRGGDPATVTGIENLKVWIQKALRTARNTYPIYSSDFGVTEPYELVGRPVTPELVGIYAREIEDALLVHDRITEVRDFRFSVVDDVLYTSFAVVVDGMEVALTDLEIGE